MSLQTVNAKTLKTWLDSGEAIMLDVREPAEHAAEKIPGTQLLPVSQISKKNLPDLNGKKLVVHCRAGMRGTNACQKLLAEDPSLEIYNLEGGITAWSNAGYPVEKSDRFFLPLDRQVQLTIGLGVLTGSLLTYFVSPLFVLLTGFFGAGLTFAGISGICALAQLMAKMPWNQSQQNTKLTCCGK